LDDDTAAAISEVSQGKDGQIKLKFYDKRAALETLGRHLGMFKDTLEIGGTVSFIIEGAPEAG
jgi:phage terminase small subunit